MCKTGDGSGHHFYSQKFCGSPLCCNCGSENSPAHNRRKAMLYEKLDWANELGNITFTVPKSLKTIKDSEMFKLVRDFLMDHFSKFFLPVEAAVLVFHPTGHKLTKHPHIQAVFPIEDGEGLIPKKRLRLLSKAYTKFMKRRYPDNEELGDRDCPMVQVKYRYENTSQKKAHAIKYVTRLDFLTASQFLTLDDGIKHYLVSFRGHRLIRGVGKLSDRNWKAYVVEKTGKRVDDSLSQLDNGACPVCLDQLVFQTTLPSFLIDDLGLKEIHPGYFCDLDTYEEFRELYRSDYG